MRSNKSNLYGSGFDNDDERKPLTVLEAKSIHSGKVTVIGTLISISEMYIIQTKNGNANTVPEYRDAKSIQLEDTEKLDENERLDVTLYDDMIKNVVIGEVVKVRGDIQVEAKKENGRSKKKINVLHATSIDYVNRKEVVITQNDIKNFIRFSELPNLIERLVSMFAPNIVGHDEVKLGLLRAIVGGVDRGEKSGGRIDTLAVGDIGTGKSKLAKEATKIKLNSRIVSAPHASTKTITAIVEKENESTTLRLGAIPLSRGAICAINEVTTFSFEEQSRLLDVLEDGKIILDKQGHHFEISAPTTIIATANPIQGDWSNSQVISNDEIELRKNLLDRFSQVYAFRDKTEEQEIKTYVEEQTKIDSRATHNYNFLRKYLIHASSIKDIRINSEAREMLNKFWIDAKMKGLLSMRKYNAMFKIAEAYAKLQLKDNVDEDIAEQTMESMRNMIVQYGPTVGMVIGPRQVTYNIFIEIIKQLQVGITIEALCEKACQNNKQVSQYLGKKWTIEQSHKLRAVIDMILNNSCIKLIQSKPVVFQWLSDVSDASDNKTENTPSAAVRISKANVCKNVEMTSDRSDTSEIEENNNDIKKVCPYCSEHLEPFYGRVHLQNCDEKRRAITTAISNESNTAYACQVLVNHLSRNSSG